MSSASSSMEIPALILRTLDWERMSLLKGMSCDRLRVILGSAFFMGCFSVKGRPETLSRPSVSSPHLLSPLTLGRRGRRAGDEGIDIPVDRLGAAHPDLRPDAPHPVREARNEAEIFADMLFADQPHGHDAAGRQEDRRAEEPLQHEDAFGVMAQRAVPKIRGDRLRLVEPLMQRQKLLRRAAPFFHGGKRVVIAMSHGGLLKTHAGNSWFS